MNPIAKRRSQRRIEVYSKTNRPEHPEGVFEEDLRGELKDHPYIFHPDVFD